jgi:SAM-dependent methyltransferase
MKSSTPVPSPTVMPVDRQRWAQELHLSNFINTYYQHRDLSTLAGVQSVLIVGPGQGLDVQVLRWRGYQVTTFDIDELFGPDYIGSVHDLRAFSDGQFDAVVVSHVLEHLAVPYLDASLKEIARVGQYALIYLPIYGLHVRLRITSNLRDLDLAAIVSFFNYFEKPDGLTPRYMGGQHFWEVGMRGFKPSDIAKRMSRFFEILAVYRNRDWIASQNYVLRSKLMPRQS